MKRLLYFFAAVAMVLSGGCSKEVGPGESNGAIALAPVMGGGNTSTRALLYKTEPELRGDLIHAYAYLSGTTISYFSSDVKFAAEAMTEAERQWLFYNNGSYTNYYWPIQGSLDFFAAVPSNCGYVTVNPNTNPPTFTANMPLSNDSGTVNQENMKEFMYAYTPDREKSQGVVPLAFNHPFAAIVFKVSQSHRDLTVNSITINDIAYSGTCTLDEDNPDSQVWSGTSKGDLALAVGKIIPGQVNFGGELCGPYLVLPQVNSGEDANKKVIEIEFHWKGTPDSGWDSVEGKSDTYKITGRIANDWEASKVYTYTLDLGNSREEILFKVTVNEWDYIYEHEFEIE